MTRVCTHCGDRKPPRQFWKRKKRRDGLSPICADCEKTLYREIRQGLRKRCTSCRKALPSTAECFHRSGGVRLHSACKVCRREAQRVLTVKDPVKPNRSAWCECGLAKQPTSNACTRCLWMDGRAPDEANMIAALRVSKGSGTLDSLELDGVVSRRQVYRSVRKLVNSGRVVEMRDMSIAPDDIGTIDENRRYCEVLYVLTDNGG